MEPTSTVTSAVGFSSSRTVSGEGVASDTVTGGGGGSGSGALPPPPHAPTNSAIPPLPAPARAGTATRTAASGTDYQAITSGTLTFAPGDTTKTVSVTVTGDDLDED
ncbi:MAG: hypothetical protein OXC70_08950, partial [Gammaproteobacteria bacterium]|nr:hypothetical protein [Gammaproteobacteria bacterium]